MANSYLSRTPGTATNNNKFTLSVWAKRSKLTGDYQAIFDSRISGGGSAGLGLFWGNDESVWYNSGTSSSAIQNTSTSAKFRDMNAWYHIVVAGDTTQSGTDKLKIWVNGVQQTSFGNDGRSSFVGLSYDLGNATYANEIGRKHDGTYYYNGYLSHIAFVDGTALTPTSFGETDSTSGIWKFKSPSGITWGTNGFHLKFENSGNLGLDSSGQTNNFTFNGNLKQSLSTPSNIYQSLNPNSTDSGVTLSNGCTTAGFDGSVGNAKGQFAVTKGKWYFECKITAQTNYPMIGIGEINRNQMEKRTGGSYPGGFQDSYGVYGNGNVYANGSNTGSQSFTYATNDIISVIIDLDSATKTIKWNKNGTQIATTNITNAGDDFAYAPMDYNGGENGVVCNYNFGEGRFGTTDIASAGSNGNGSLFEYDVPSGHYAINTKNLNTYG